MGWMDVERLPVGETLGSLLSPGVGAGQEEEKLAMEAEHGT